MSESVSSKYLESSVDFNDNFIDNYSLSSSSSKNYQLGNFYNCCIRAVKLTPEGLLNKQKCILGIWNLKEIAKINRQKKLNFNRSLANNLKGKKFITKNYMASNKNIGIKRKCLSQILEEEDQKEFQEKYNQMLLKENSDEKGKENEASFEGSINNNNNRKKMNGIAKYTNSQKSIFENLHKNLMDSKLKNNNGNVNNKKLVASNSAVCIGGTNNKNMEKCYIVAKDKDELFNEDDYNINKLNGNIQNNNNSTINNNISKMSNNNINESKISGSKNKFSILDSSNARKNSSLYIKKLSYKQRIAKYNNQHIKHNAEKKGGKRYATFKRIIKYLESNNITLNEFLEKNPFQDKPYLIPRAYEFMNSVKFKDYKYVTEALEYSTKYLFVIDYMRQTAYHWAAKLRDVKMLQILIRFGLALNQNDYKNRTPLHFAALNNDYALCEVLLKNYANPTTYDINGKSPADYSTDLRVKSLLHEYSASKYVNPIARGKINDFLKEREARIKDKKLQKQKELELERKKKLKELEDEDVDEIEYEDKYNVKEDNLNDNKNDE